MPLRSIILLLLAPATPASVYYVALDGDDANPGARERPWRHIEWAMTRPFLRPGDTIRIRGGVYRPAIEQNPRRDSPTDDTLIRPVSSGEPGRPILVEAEPGEAVLLTGRLWATSWQPAAGLEGAYFHEYSSPLLYPFEHPFQVAEHGRLLFQVTSLEALDRPGRCLVDTSSRRIYVSPTGAGSPEPSAIEYAVSVSGIELRNGAAHWRLSGFALAGFRTTAVVVADRSGPIEIDRMDISQVGNHRPGGDLSSGHAVAVYGSSGGNRVVHSNLHHTLAEAIHVSQAAQGDLYENNDIHDNGGSAWFHQNHTGRLLTGPGMILRGSRVTVRGNRFFSNGYHGLILESDLMGSEGRSSPSHNLVEGNVFAFNLGNGLYADGKNGLEASVANLLRFNLFDRNNQARAASGDGELRLAGNFDDTLIYNNTFYTDKANAVFLLGGRVSNGSAQGADAAPDRWRLLNNIAVQSSRSPQVYPLRALEAPTGGVLDYNNWHRAGGSSGALIAWNGTEFASLEEFRSRTAQERHGLSLDPRFVSAENGHFWLRAVSPVIGRGWSDGGLDLGAFPYRPLLAVTPAELRFTALAGGPRPAVQSLAIRSSAGIPLRWTARSAEGWLQLAAATGEAPAQLQVSIRSDLGPGAHPATVEVRPALEGEPAMSVRVWLTVLPAPPRRR